MKAATIKFGTIMSSSDTSQLREALTDLVRIFNRAGYSSQTGSSKNLFVDGKKLDLHKKKASEIIQQMILNGFSLPVVAEKQYNGYGPKKQTTYVPGKVELCFENSRSRLDLKMEAKRSAWRDILGVDVFFGLVRPAPRITEATPTIELTYLISTDLHHNIGQEQTKLEAKIKAVAEKYKVTK
jgi:hypothetical protein